MDGFYEFLALVKESLKRHWLLWLVALFALILLVGYTAGFRPGPGLTVVRVGTLVVTGIPAGTTVYADLAPRGSSRGSDFHIQLVPGSHTIIVDAPGDEPWEQIVTVASNRDTEISPILVPKEPMLRELSGAAAASVIAAGAALPSEHAPLRMGCANVFVSLNRVVAAPASTTPGCAPPEFLCGENSCEPTISYAPAADIRSVIPFPGRTDAVIVAAGAWVYAVALDPRSPQFFAPVFQGPAPALAAGPDSSFYITDRGKAYLVSF